MLEADGVTLAYGRAAPAVRATSLRIAAGEIVALCGPNGSGKSTLLGALSGDLLPRDGEVRLNGVALDMLSPGVLARGRAVLEQSPNLSAAFSVETLAGIAIPREIAPVEAAAIVRDVLVDLDLDALATSPVDRLSGGQRHRAHLARALVQLTAGRNLGAGHALMLDEPTASLDLMHQITVMRAARRAAGEGAAVVVVLHDLNLAGAFADRVALMGAGRLLVVGPPDEVLTEDMLGALYKTPLRVDRDPAGLPRVTPVFPARDQTP